MSTGRPVSPCAANEHDQPGAMLHVCVVEFGNISGGGGWRFVARAQGARNRSATPNKPKNTYGNPKMGHAFVHTVIDDHSWAAYAEVHDDETAATATGVLRRAVAWFAIRGITPPSGCCPTTARLTSPTCGATSALSWRSITPGPGPGPGHGARSMTRFCGHLDRDLVQRTR